MALSAIPDDTDWPSEILDAVLPEFLAVVDVVKPGVSGYSVDTNTVTEDGDTVILSARPARIQNMRIPVESVGAFEWSGKSRYLIQIENRTGDALVEKGMVVRVRSGGNDKDLESWGFQVLGVTSSSHELLRNIMTFSEYGVVPHA